MALCWWALLRIASQSHCAALRPHSTASHSPGHAMHCEAQHRLYLMDCTHSTAPPILHHEDGTTPMSRVSAG
eukprot:8190057-Pyramimonas_sp.AAC.1